MDSKKILAALIIVVLALMVACLFSGCNTWMGVWKDVENGSRNVQNASRPLANRVEEFDEAQKQKAEETRIDRAASILEKHNQNIEAIQKAANEKVGS